MYPVDFIVFPFNETLLNNILIGHRMSDSSIESVSCARRLCGDYSVLTIFFFPLVLVDVYVYYTCMYYYNCEAAAVWLLHDGARGKAISTAQPAIRHPQIFIRKEKPNLIERWPFGCAHMNGWVCPCMLLYNISLSVDYVEADRLLWQRWLTQWQFVWIAFCYWFFLLLLFRFFVFDISCIFIRC